MEAFYNRLCASSALLNAWKVVKSKGSSGGIDGISIQEFDEHIGEHIQEIQQSLKNHTWVPEPYLRVYIPKKDNEKRKLGLLCIKDKIVQQAIKQLIEPRFEKVFVPNSYAYRPEKGHARAIKYTRHCCRNSKKPIILRLDIDNYFDNINHEILLRRIRPIIADEEIIRLVELCVKMGVVSSKLQWDSICQGVPQGAVLSPILANFYLHSFDQYVLTRTDKYVRYADDFIIFCDTVEQAQDLLVEGSAFLKERLKLGLNEPYMGEVKNGFEFLGIQLDNQHISITEEKRQVLCSRIQELDWYDKGFSQEGLKHLQGIRNYYGVLLPQAYLQTLDEVLITRIKEVISQRWQSIPNKTTLASALKSIVFFADETLLQKVSIKNELVNHYLMQRTQQRHDDNVKQNQKLIRQKKQEYRKKESEVTELLVNTYGTFIGVSQKGIAVKVFGKQKTMPPTHNLRHITILSNGVSISSNAISYCMQRHIPIDYFGANGQHVASVLSL